MMSTMSLIFLIIFIPTALTLSFIPYLTRKTESFGVTIQESMYDRPTFQSMRKKYALLMILIAILLTTLMIIISFLNNESLETIFFSIAVITYVILSFAIYIPFHLKMKKIKEDENWFEGQPSTIVIDTSFRSGKVTYSNGWFLIPIAIIFITIIVSFVLYDKIPDEVPTHTSFSGKVTYNDKSPGVLLFLPLTQLFLIGVMAAVNYSIMHAKQQVSAKKPHISKEQNIIFRRRWSLFTIITAILMTLMFTFMQIAMIFQQLLAFQDIVLLIVIGIILIGTIAITIKTGQGGSRVKIETEQESNMSQLDDDRFWKLGQFYVNKNDPSFFVEKRFGIGWTLNFAHPIVWIILIVLLVVPFLTLLLI